MWESLTQEQKAERVKNGNFIEIDIQGRSFYVVSFQRSSNGGLEVEWFSEVDVPEEDRKILDKHIGNAMIEILREQSMSTQGPANL